MNVEEQTDFVKSQMEFHLRQADRFKTDKRRNELHSGTAAKFKLLYDWIIEANDKIKNLPVALNELDRPKGSINVPWDEVKDMPLELLEELSISDSDKSDYVVVSIVERVGGVASLDRILVELYKETGEVVKRANLNARIYRMIQKEALYSVPSKKGVYSTMEILESEPEIQSDMIG